LAIGLPASRRRLIGSTALTGCGVAGSAHPQAATVVASTDVWGRVARAVTGRHVSVKSILSGADVDPHSYQVSPAAAAARVVASPVAAIMASVIFAEVSAVGGIVLSLAPGVPVSVFVATISFLIYLFCRLLGRRREAAGA
jgi:Zinc-uptake complex component A periplasmic